MHYNQELDIVFKVSTFLTIGLYLVYTDGTIIEYEWMNDTSLQKVHKDRVAYDSCGYAAVVDNFGGLQIAGGYGKASVMIHPFTKQRVKSKVPLRNFDYSALRIIVGPFLWILGGSHGCHTSNPVSNINIHNINNSQMFEYVDKKRWILGPDLPKGVAFMYSSGMAINRTAVIVIGASPTKPHHLWMYASEGIVQIDKNSKDAYKMSFIYNLENKSWRRIVDLPKDLSNGGKYNMPLTITINKNGSKLLQVFGFENNNGIIYLNENEVTLWILDLELMAWSSQKLHTDKFVTFGNDIEK